MSALVCILRTVVVLVVQVESDWPRNTLVASRRRSIHETMPSESATGINLNLPAFALLETTFSSPLNSDVEKSLSLSALAAAQAAAIMIMIMIVAMATVDSSLGPGFATSGFLRVPTLRLRSPAGRWWTLPRFSSESDH